ncbi:unnamed protein product [Leuciscus chuanchicus]
MADGELTELAGEAHTSVDWHWSIEPLMTITKRKLRAEVTRRYDAPYGEVWKKVTSPNQTPKLSSRTDHLIPFVHW